jgi:predicted esterase
MNIKYHIPFQLIFFHGLGDQGDGWASVFKNEIRIPYMKCIFPNAQSRPVTLNFGMRMPAWYDILGLSPNSQEVKINNIFIL